MTTKSLPTVLEARNISKLYPTPDGSLTVISEIDLKIDEAESVAIVGVSGSGKTTLLSLLAGLDSPSSGEIFLAEHDLTRADEDERARLRREYVGFVFQQFHLMPNLTALENVALPLDLTKSDSTQDRASKSLEEVGLSHRLHHYPRALSGGEQQRVALARAFCTEPKILFADEPTGNLDRATADTTSDLLFGLNAKKGTTLILVTHDERLAARCARQIKLVDGRITEDTGRPKIEADVRIDVGKANESTLS